MGKICNTYEEACAEYNKHLTSHISAVMQAYRWLVSKTIIDEDAAIEEQLAHHDESKYSVEEYEPYVRKFNMEVTPEIKKAFRNAFVSHIRSNPHHWNYYVHKNESGETELLEVPHKYLIEMVCDWMSFGFVDNNISEVFDWYANNKDVIQMNEKSRKEIEDILDKVRSELR